MFLKAQEGSLGLIYLNFHNCVLSDKNTIKKIAPPCGTTGVSALDKPLERQDHRWGHGVRGPSVVWALPGAAGAHWEGEEGPGPGPAGLPSGPLQPAREKRGSPTGQAAWQ